jgi:two-component system, response regulator PdtaR
MPNRPSVLIVEDEALLAVELGFLVQEAGCVEIGHALDSAVAVQLAGRLKPDIALVDVHLADGPTGVDAAREIAAHHGAMVLFMTANVKRLPEDLAGACGVIGKPYTDRAVRRALTYLVGCRERGRAETPPPPGLILSESYAARWGVHRLEKTA